MVTQIIEAFPTEKREAASDGSKVLHVSELFFNTVQGENWTGVPSMFLRLQYCTLNCSWCDTAEVWRVGLPYSNIELLNMFEESGAVTQLRKGQHLILTGGSPLRQQDGLIDLIERFVVRFGFKPIIEIENECTLEPEYKMMEMVDIWNNSPKLENSGNKKDVRYKPEVMKILTSLDNSYFKFVVTSEDDWKEIQRDFLDAGLLTRDQIVLMPEGATREELYKHYEACVNLACQEGVRMSDRLQVTIWNKTTGV